MIHSEIWDLLTAESTNVSRYSTRRTASPSPYQGNIYSHGVAPQRQFQDLKYPVHDERLGHDFSLSSVYKTCLCSACCWCPASPHISGCIALLTTHDQLHLIRATNLVNLTWKLKNCISSYSSQACVMISPILSCVCFLAIFPPFSQARPSSPTLRAPHLETRDVTNSSKAGLAWANGKWVDMKQYESTGKVSWCVLHSCRPDPNN